MINAEQFRTLIIRPVIEHLGMWSHSAEELLLGTAAQESGLGSWVKQINGPALGPYQQEPDTHDDIWENYLAFRPDLAEKVRHFEIPGWYDGNNSKEMVGNLYYATAMCRVHYWRVPEALPPVDNVVMLGTYWKNHYNTIEGRGTVADYVRNYHRIVKSR